MALYQPQQGLTWEYDDATGELKIVDKISLDLAAGEKVNYSVSSNISDTYFISIFVSTSGLHTPPVTLKIVHANIGSGLADVTIVRRIIESIDPVHVVITVYMATDVKGDAIATSTSRSDVSIV
jgi:hypothetical protein